VFWNFFLKIKLYADVKSELQREISHIEEEINREEMETESLRLIHEQSLMEAQRHKESLLEGIEKELQKKKDLRDTYVSNMKVLIRMLLKSSSNVSEYYINVLIQVHHSLSFQICVWGEREDPLRIS